MINKHWTANNIQDLVYAIIFDLYISLEMDMPDHIPTVKELVEATKARGMKLALVAYNDGDKENRWGPISPWIFAECWEILNKPKTRFDMDAIKK